jgi:hypothetical protein
MFSNKYLAKKWRIYPIIKWVRVFGGENSNGNFQILVRESSDVNLSYLPLVGDKSIVTMLTRATGAITAQNFNRMVNAQDLRIVQEPLKYGDRSATNVKRFRVGKRVNVHCS